MGLTLITLTVLASFSPLLTLARLWQVKEWRMDRMKEHLRNEGWFRQLFGITRPAIVLAGIIAIVIGVPFGAGGTLGALGLLTLVQIILKKQSYPVWTQKAVALVTSSLTLTILISFLILNSQFSILIAVPIIQAPILILSWFLFLPIDRFLKQRIMRKAMRIRAEHDDLTVIGITGSVGKTTVKELLAHILADRNPMVTPAYVNSEMGVAKWLISKLTIPDSRSHDLTVIVEMGAYRRGEIKLLCQIAKPQMGVITFIGKQHIALFGSQETLQDTKAELVESLPEDGHAFLNADCGLCNDLRTRCPCPVTTVGTGGHADLEAFDIEETGNGIRFKAGDTAFSVPLAGTHNVINVLLATAVAQQLGMNRQDVATRLRSYSPPSHTFAMRKEESVTILDDTHNASPESFKAAIAWARTQPIEHKVLLTPGLIELGENQDQIHAELGGLADAVFDRVIFLNKKSAQNFAQGYKGNVELVSRDTSPVNQDSLLVCVGRMSEATIQKVLPR